MPRAASAGRRDDQRPRRAPRGDGRPELGGAIVEGRQAVRELLAANRRRVFEVVVASSREGNARLDEIAELASAAGAKVRHVSPAELEQLARTDAPQGVVARAAAVTPAALDALLEAPDAFLVALDGVTDPQNLGAVLRTAEASGASGVIVPRHRSAHLGPTAVKAAAGAVEHVPIALASGVPAVLERAARAGVWSVGLDAAGDVAVHELDLWDRPVLLVLGAEGEGLSRLARKRCDVLAAIPMRGRIASLNVAAAAAVACFEVAKARARATGPAGESTRRDTLGASPG